MKKVITLIGSLLIFAGGKAQTITPVKKETIKPDVVKPIAPDSITTDKAHKETVKPIKEIEKPDKGVVKIHKATSTVPIKVVKASVNKPHKD